MVVCSNTPPRTFAASAGETLATNITAAIAATARTLIVRLTSYLLTIRAADTLSVPTITDQITWWYRIDLSELDHVEVFGRTYGSSERGFGLGRQRLWIDEPARAQVGEDEPLYAGLAGRLSCIGRR